MPRSRSSELSSQRQSPRVPLHLKTTAASEANSLHRLNTDRSSPKPDDHRSPRGGGGGGGALHHPHEKKRGTKVADLETRLGHAQEELKKLKDQLASAEAAKRDAQKELQEAKKQIPAATTAEEEEETTHEPEQQEEEHPKINTDPPASTDVFEVVPCPAAPAEIEPDSEGKIESLEKSEVKEAMVDVEVEEKSKSEEFPDIPEVTELRAKLAEKEKELEIRLLEKETLTKQASEAAESATAARAKEEELWAKVGRIEEELRESRARGERLGEKLDAAEEAKEELEAEMKKLRVQSDQWRKAAEAAAAVLSAGEAGGGRRVGERCGSMDKHLSSSGYGSVWSPVMGGEEMEEEEVVSAAAAGGGGKRKSSGIRMFGDLWKKKGQHK